MTAMNIPAPHFLLTSQINLGKESGRWRFALRSADGAQRFEAEDAEPGLQGERLDLLTVVRALESLDQPSQVTLVDCSQYIWKGVRYGLPEWRANGWRWEFFGQMVPVKNCDLWQRMDRALTFHEVECRRRRFDPPHQVVCKPCSAIRGKKTAWGISDKLWGWIKYTASRLPQAWQRRLKAALRTCRRWAFRSWKPRTAFPWTA
jgi:ribonuclease HI